MGGFPDWWPLFLKPRAQLLLCCTAPYSGRRRCDLLEGREQQARDISLNQPKKPPQDIPAPSDWEGSTLTRIGIFLEELQGTEEQPSPFLQLSWNLLHVVLSKPLVTLVCSHGLHKDKCACGQNRRKDLWRDRFFFFRFFLATSKENWHWKPMFSATANNVTMPQEQGWKTPPRAH